MKISDSGMPLPEMSELTQPFWDGAKNDKLTMQQCAACKAINFYPKPWCVECGSPSLEWKNLSGRGTVYTFTVSEIVMMNLPAWKDQLPVISALIDLEEGGRMYAIIKDCDPSEVHIGMNVTVDFMTISESAKVPVFKPTSK